MNIIASRRIFFTVSIVVLLIIATGTIWLQQSAARALSQVTGISLYMSDIDYVLVRQRITIGPQEKGFPRERYRINNPAVIPELLAASRMLPSELRNEKARESSKAAIAYSVHDRPALAPVLYSLDDPRSEAEPQPVTERLFRTAQRAFGRQSMDDLRSIISSLGPCLLLTTRWTGTDYNDWKLVALEDSPKSRKLLKRYIQALPTSLYVDIFSDSSILLMNNGEGEDFFDLPSPGWDDPVPQPAQGIWEEILECEGWRTATKDELRPRVRIIR